MKKIIYILLFILMISLVTALEIKDYKKLNENVNITTFCFDNANSYCPREYKCNITIINPNGFVIVDNKPMTNLSNQYNYTINFSKTGDYKVSTICTNNVLYGNENYMLRVNEQGGEYQGYGLYGFYIILFVISIVYIAASFLLNKVHIVPKILLFFMSIVNLIIGILISYLDSVSFDYNSIILGLFIGNGTIFIVVGYFYLIQVFQDVADQDKEDLEGLN